VFADCIPKLREGNTGYLASIAAGLRAVPQATETHVKSELLKGIYEFILRRIEMSNDSQILQNNLDVQKTN
jgi:hypothetical protein